MERFQQQTEALIPAHVHMIAACHTEQTAADVGNAAELAQLPPGTAGGACTSALLSVLQENPKISYQQVLLKLRERLLSRNLDQIPQLTSSRPLELEETPFDLHTQNTARAVLIGINYKGQNGQLRGCHNDVLRMKKYLVDHQGFYEHNILLLLDDGNHHRPTRQTILTALQQLVAQSMAGDVAFVHYSGHGGLLSPNWNRWKQSLKAYDETVYPVDHARAGQIRDFSLFSHFVQPMPAGVRVTCVFDCCHSGAVLELPYSYQATSATAIRSRRAMDSLSNLALMYVMMGGMLPGGLFDNVTDQIEGATGESLESMQGQGMGDDDFGGVGDTTADTTGTEDYTGDAYDTRDADVYGATNGTDHDADAVDLGNGNGVDGFGDQAGIDGCGDNNGLDGCGDETDCGCVADSLIDTLNDM